MPNWISAKEARDLVARGYSEFGEVGVSDDSLHRAEWALINRLQHDALSAEANIICMREEMPSGEIVETVTNNDLLPKGFWKYISYGLGTSLDWVAGDFSFKNFRVIDCYDCLYEGMAFGVRLDRDCLPSASDESNDKNITVAAGTSTGGRPPKWEWTAAVNAVWGRIYRGEFKPKSQAQVENALRNVLTSDDDEPSESSLRKHARPLWTEYQAEGENPDN